MIPSKSTDLTSFLRECRLALGDSAVSCSQDAGPYEENLSRFDRKVAGVVRPSSTADVQKIVELAARFLVAIHPISRGKNWGLGSKAPVMNDSVILDLSLMDRIIEVDAALGFAVIQPGVTQAQLSRYLRDQNIPWTLDVTGSGADTSIVGNSMERGVAYNSHRVESISTMEVVLGNGSTIRTGYGHYKGAKAAPVFRYGIGPALDGLFFQSNMGIVTEATVLLRKPPESEESFVLSVTSTEFLPDLVEALRGLMQSDVLHCITHIFNKERFFPAMAPLISLEAEKLGFSLNRQQIESLMERKFQGRWWAVGNISGDPVWRKRRKKLVKRALAPFGKISFMTPAKTAFAKSVLGFFQAREDLAILNATDCLRGLTRGEPTQATLYSVLWPVTRDFKQWDPLEPDQGPGGFLYCVPIIPLTSEDTWSILALLKEVGDRHGFKPAISINPVSMRFAEIVASIDFHREDRENLTRAHQCIKEMNSRLFAEGYPPYRIDIENMKMALSPEDSHCIAAATIKRALDPEGILSPGKYGLS